MSKISQAEYDVAIIGAGAAGMMAAIEAGRRGRSVLLIDHADTPGEKIRISGGGRCNFTNTRTTHANFISQNPHFCKSALTRYTPTDFIKWVNAKNIAWHEKTLGQLFCDGPSIQIINMLTEHCEHANVETCLSTSVERVEKTDDRFRLLTSEGPVVTSSLVIATGGKSIPKMGATDFAYRIADQFGLNIVTTRPALVPFTFGTELLEQTKPLSGISADAEIRCNGTSFREALLFTHRGISGPSILQISSYWREGDEIEINLTPDINLYEDLKAGRQKNGKLAPHTVMATHLPKRLAEWVTKRAHVPEKFGDLSDKHLKALAGGAQQWRVKPVGSEGYRTAEVTLGGIDTNDLSSKTMEAKSVSGLYFIGEAVDVTGWLGGYNFQWAWSSGWAAGQVI
ncbi:BaiN/RdsA family NAD(P)/FAD-dependent oxidoreductase [Hyphococcus lacteus]|uniref:NAD(P)/FAD-dependent oxidoreductase n=1 Tax=Hyphococcus lacteus TaxID=3143536 RepID=A0ABV3Z317_9PROT